MITGEALMGQLAGRDAATAKEVLQALHGPSAPCVELDAALEALRFFRDLQVARTLAPDVRTLVSAVRRDTARLRGRRFSLKATLPADFSQIPDRDLVRKAIALVWDAATIYEGRAQLAEDLSLATPAQRGLYGAWWTQSEVCNGGFGQYFSNPTAVVAEWALEGFRQQGAPTLATCLEEAARQFPTDVDLTDQLARQAAMEAFAPDVFEAVDQSFFAAVEAEFMPLAAAFVRGNIDRFFLR